MAGSPGATASIHIKQLGLFGMLLRLPGSILHRIARKKLHSAPDDSNSWFIQIRHLCVKYNLPSPLFLLSHTPSKTSFKSLVRRKVIDFWQTKLRDDSSSKPSLLYFKPQFMSLQAPHPLWTTSKQNPFEINKSLVVAKMLSGQYRSDWHCRHWSKINKDGFCPLCPGSSIPGTLEHMLVLWWQKKITSWLLVWADSEQSEPPETSPDNALFWTFCVSPVSSGSFSRTIGNLWLPIGKVHSWWNLRPHQNILLWTS